jgi:hypothetical protein
MSFAAYALLNEHHDPDDEDSNQARRHGGTQRSKVFGTHTREVGVFFCRKKKLRTSLSL